MQRVGSVGAIGRIGLGARLLGGLSGGPLPVNLVAPAITGPLAQNADVTLDVGLWSGTITGFEIEVLQVSPAATLVARQAVTGTTTGTLTAAVGSTLVLNVWATGPGGTTLATSAAFGPILPAGDTFVAGLVISADGAANPTPSGYPVTNNILGPNPVAHQYSLIAAWASGVSYVAGDVRRQGGYLYTAAASHTSGTFATDLAAGRWVRSGPSYGWVGTSANSTGLFLSQSKGDVRLNGRMSQNLAPAALGIQIDLPDGPGVYKVFMGFTGTAATITPNVDIRDGGAAAAILRTINPGLLTCTPTQIMDAAANITSIAAWQAASTYGGQPVEVTATGNALWIGRTATSGLPGINHVAVLRKAA